MAPRSAFFPSFRFYHASTCTSDDRFPYTRRATSSSTRWNRKKNVATHPSLHSPPGSPAAYDIDQSGDFSSSSTAIPESLFIAVPSRTIQRFALTLQLATILYTFNVGIISPRYDSHWRSKSSTSVSETELAFFARGIDVLDRTSARQWIALVYFACVIGGLSSIFFVLLYAVFVENAPWWLPQCCLCCCGEREDLSRRATRVYLERPLFSYATTDAQIALDSHADYEDYFGPTARGSVLSKLWKLFYVFQPILALIDVAMIVDVTASTEDSFAKPKVGSLSLLQGIVTLLGLIAALVPPRRWFQRHAEQYLERRGY